MRRRSSVAAALAFVIALAILSMALAGAALADTGDIIEGPPNGQPESPKDGWQAGTCTTDEPECSSETRNQFFTQAAGHPQSGFTQFITKHTEGLLGAVTVDGVLKDLRVDFPAGLSFNPDATAKCEVATFEAGGCASDTQIGTSQVTAAEGLVIPLPKVPLYNLVPEQGKPALFGFTPLPGTNVFLKADVDWAGDYHEGFTIAVPEPPLGKILKNRLVGFGRAGNGTFLTNPSTCLNPEVSPNQGIYSTFLRADSKEAPNPTFPAGSTFFESPLPHGIAPTGCAQVPFEPSVSLDANGVATESPSGPTVTVSLPFKEEGTAIGQSNVRDAAVALPEGNSLNPSAAPKVGFCSDAQFGKGTTNPISCPANSVIGTAAIETPPLPAGSLTGNVYLGSQLSREPETGNEYRIFIDAVSSRYGVDVRLVGNVIANAATGQLTAVIREAPQVPFTSVKLSLSPTLGPITSSPVCSGKAESSFTPWSGTAPKRPTAELTLTKAPGGGPCPKTLQERPFAPSVAAAPVTAQAAAYTPYNLTMNRTEGQQEIKGFHLTLPPGATAKIAGVAYCESSEYSAAFAKSGAEEVKTPSCNAQSEIGVATILSGSGPTPLKIGGKVYLSGPYEGKPLSAVVITPGIAGPFDLGNVVVRAPLGLNPETAQIEASGEIPHMYGGAKLDIRSIQVSLNRKEFALNGTNCNANATTGAILGSGSNPAVPAAWSSFAISVPYQGQGCEALNFKPKLKLRLYGQTGRAKHPKLTATLTTQPGDANLAIASVALPHTIFLDQASLGTVCTRPQFAAEQCPAKSRYGYARAWSPLLANPVGGPVYLRSSDNKLPDMVFDLKGQVNIALDGRIDSFKGGIRTTFGQVPDVPVSKFLLQLPGGKHGLLQSSVSLCAKPVKGLIRLTGQNGKKANSNVRIQTPCKKHKKKHGKKHKGKHGNKQKGGGHKQKGKQ